LNGTLYGTLRVRSFLGCFEGALGGGSHRGERALDSAVLEARAGESFNDRQRKVVNRLLNGIN
jgi:hypothetical protein